MEYGACRTFLVPSDCRPITGESADVSPRTKGASWGACALSSGIPLTENPVDQKTKSLRPAFATIAHYGIRSGEIAKTMPLPICLKGRAAPNGNDKSRRFCSARESRVGNFVQQPMSGNQIDPTAEPDIFDFARVSKPSRPPPCGIDRRGRLCLFCDCCFGKKEMLMTHR